MKTLKETCEDIIFDEIEEGQTFFNSLGNEFTIIGKSSEDKNKYFNVSYNGCREQRTIIVWFMSSHPDKDILLYKPIIQK